MRIRGLADLIAAIAGVVGICYVLILARVWKCGIAGEIYVSAVATIFCLAGIGGLVWFIVYGLRAAAANQLDYYNRGTFPISIAGAMLVIFILVIVILAIWFGQFA